MTTCNYCWHIVTTTSSTNFKQINGTVFYFTDNASLKRYVKKCCMLKYGYDELNRGEDFNNRILSLLKVKSPKYVLLNNEPIMVFEINFKSQENIINPYGYPTMPGTSPNQNIISVNRFITFQVIPEPYQFISKKQYINLLNKPSPTHALTDNIVDLSMSDNIHYIYLLQERTAVESNLNVYKIGKSTQVNYKRFDGYHKGFKLLLHIACNNCHVRETEIMNLFKIKYIQYTKFGLEYFEGNCQEMMKDIILIIFNN
jgi:hypothetical protein